MTGKLRKMRGRRNMSFSRFGWRRVCLSKIFSFFENDLVLAVRAGPCSSLGMGDMFSSSSLPWFSVASSLTSTL